jgi:hypothetical protein
MSGYAIDARERPRKPKLPKPGHALAVAIELAIVGTFTAHHSYVGLALCAAYAWYSATWALVVLLREEEP